MRLKSGFALLLVPLISFADHFEIPVIGGVTFSEPENERDVTVNSSPLVINDYVTDQDMRAGYLTGLGLVYSLEHVTPAPFTYNFGLMVYYLNLGEVQGTEYPFINQGSFDTLDYRFKSQSLAFMLQPKIIMTSFDYQPYVFLGLGVAKNYLYDYKEGPTDPSSSAAATDPFENKMLTSFAYEVGIGIQHEIPYHHNDLFRYVFSVDYRYINLGQAALGFRDNQTTRESIEVNNLNTQSLVFAVTVQF